MRYPTPAGRIRVEHRQSNSRFLATLDRASSIEEARSLLRAIREEMPGATHHVHAMRIGYGASVTEGMSDDGEPSGTSGPPALAVLRGADVGDVLLVITRWFGGTKLGTGGLVSAYGEAAKLAVAAMETVERIDRVPLRFRLTYDQYRKVRQYLDRAEALIEGEEFAADVLVDARVPADRAAEIREAIVGLTFGQALFEE